MVGEVVMKPAWLESLMGETFFDVCGAHESRKKNEQNIFCLDCCRRICPHCLPSHPSHALLQVRRYVYHDVVRMKDLEKLIDCSSVQPYTINNAKVVFLNPRQQSRICKDTSANICFTCDRILHDKFHFCSISCKVDYVFEQEGDLSSILYRFEQHESSEFAFPEFEGLRMDNSDTLLDDDYQSMQQAFMEYSSCPKKSRSGICSQKDSTCSKKSLSRRKEKENDICSENGEVVKKKKGKGFFPGLVVSLSRRKGAPQRSPLC